MPDNLTPEHIKDFGTGDKFHLCFPETGGRIVAIITRIKFESSQLTIWFKDAVEWEEDRNPKSLSHISYYVTDCIDEAFVVPGLHNNSELIHVAHPAAERTYLFVKASSPIFREFELPAR